jgi:hypothetical protein
MSQTFYQSMRRRSSDATEVALPPTSGRAHSARRERLVAGVTAGTLVLCWFVLFDSLTIGNSWYTVQRIGGAFGRFLIGGRSPTFVTSLAFFCVIHYGAWLANATLMLAVVHRGEKHPSIVIPALLLNAIFYVPFIGLITMFVELGWGSGSWVRFILGALIGGITVAALVYRAHPDIVRYELAHLDAEDG